MFRFGLIADVAAIYIITEVRNTAAGKKKFSLQAVQSRFILRFRFQLSLILVKMQEFGNDRLSWVVAFRRLTTA